MDGYFRKLSKKAQCFQAGPKSQQLAAGSHCKTLGREHLSLCVHTRRRRKLMQQLHTLQDVCALVSVWMCVCLRLCVSEVGRRDQMCVPCVCVNKDSDMYTPHTRTCSRASSSCVP